MIDVKNMFIKLTSKRYPKGTESEVINLLPDLTFQKDEFDNYYILIKKEDDTFSDTMFSCHLDTIDRGPYVSSYSTGDIWLDGKWVDKDTKLPSVPKKDEKLVKHVFDGDDIKTDGTTNLGADDKAGMVIMLNLISEKVPGLYYFFMGEETGCIGSSNLSRVFETKMTEGVYPKINRMIAFDRRGYDSVITKQMGKTCCSDEFGNDLVTRLNEYGFWYKLDTGGVYTDSAEFTDVIPECTNLSVGYFSEHTISERQDIEFLELLSVVLTKIDWDNLKTVRNHKETVYSGKKSKPTYGTAGYNSRYSEYDDYGCNSYVHNNNHSAYNVPSRSSTTKPTTVTVEEITDFDFDKWYEEQKNKSLTHVN
jgi:hypothetical protein